jgi:hypothetical protein
MATAAVANLPNEQQEEDASELIFPKGIFHTDLYVFVLLVDNCALGKFSNEPMCC